MADAVWDKIDSYGLGRIQDLISFFDSPEMKNRISNIVLGDSSLQAALNYNGASGVMNYAAIAKLGILVFSSYIYDRYINSNSWLSNLWSTGMSAIGHSGWTLVDVVNTAFTGLSTAIAAVKSGITKFVNGVKAGVEYFTNEAISLIVQSLAFGLRSIIIGLIKAIASDPNYGY